MRTGDHHVPASQWLDLRDADLQAEGSFRKLHGYDTLPLDTDQATDLDAYQIAYRGDELVAWGADDYLYSYDPQALMWRRVESWTRAGLTVSEIVPIRGDQFSPELACLGGYHVVVWEDYAGGTAGVSYAVYDSRTGRAVVTPTRLEDAGLAPRVVAGDSWWFLSWYLDTGATTKRRYTRVRLATPTQIDPLADLYDYGVLTVGLPPQPFDACADPDVADTIVLATEVADDMAVARLDAYTTQTAVLLSGLSPQVATDVAICAGIEGAPGPAVVWIDETASQSIGRVFLDSATLAVSSTLSAFAVGATMDRIACIEDPVSSLGVPSVRVMVDRVSGVEFTRAIQQYRFTAATTSTLTSYQNGRLAARPWVTRDRVHAVAYTAAEDSITQTNLVVDFDRGEIIARILGDGSAATPGTTIPSPNVVGDIVALTMGKRTTADAQGAVEYTDQAVAFAVLDYEQTPRAVAELADVLHASDAGHVRSYDGTTVFELDWHHLPEVVSAAAGGAGSMAAGTYNFAIAADWEDANGRRYRSAPTIKTVTVGASGDVTITVQSGLKTSRSNVALFVARTENTGSGGGAFYYRISNVLQPVYLNGTTITFVNGEADADINERETYDQAGDAPLLANDPTSAAGFVVALGDRLWFGDPDVPALVKFSKPLRPGVGVELTPDQVLILPTDQAAVGAIEQDGAYYGFTADTVAIWSGEGPDASGAGQQFSTARRLPTPIGATGQLAIAATPAGVVYGSSKGPRLVARDQAAIAPYSAINELFEYEGQVITAAIYAADREELVLFDDGDQNTDPQRGTVRYCIGSGRWTQETQAQAPSAARSLAGALSFLRRDGTPCTYNANSFMRGTTRTALVCGTSWLKLGYEQAMSIEAIGILGRWLSTHLLRVGICYDYNSAIVDVFDIDPDRGSVRTVPTWGTYPADTWGGSDGWGVGDTASQAYPAHDAYQFRLTGPFRTCQSVRVVVWDLTNSTTGTGASYALNMIEVEVSSKEGGKLAEIEELLTY